MRSCKLRKQLAGPTVSPGARMSRFERQAQRLGIRHELISLETGGPKQWRFARDREFGPVEVADTFIEALYQQNVAFEEDRFEPTQMVETIRRPGRRRSRRTGR